MLQQIKKYSRMFSNIANTQIQQLLQFTTLLHLPLSFSFFFYVGVNFIFIFFIEVLLMYNIK